MLCLLDGVLGELFVAGGDGDPHQLGIVCYLEGEQGEQLQAIVMTARAQPVVCLVRFAQGHRVQGQIPGGVGLHTRGAGSQHDFRDLGHLCRTALVAGVNLQFAQGHYRRRFEHADNQVGLVEAVPALQRECRLAELTHLEHLTSARGLEHPQCPVLPVSLGGRHAFVYGVKGLVVSVRGRQEPRPEVMREPLSRIFLAAESPSLGRLENLKATVEAVGW